MATDTLSAPVDIASPRRARRRRSNSTVSRIADRQRLRPGDVAEIINSRDMRNIGKQVTIIARAPHEVWSPLLEEGSMWWQVKALHEPIETYVIATGQAGGKEWTTFTRDEYLRRLHFAYVKPASRG